MRCYALAPVSLCVTISYYALNLLPTVAQELRRQPQVSPSDGLWQEFKAHMVDKGEGLGDLRQMLGSKVRTTLLPLSLTTVWTWLGKSVSWCNKMTEI